MSTEPFWQRKSLAEMTPSEWESLCDGCAKCCMIKLEDEATHEVHYTALVCELLDLDTCRCTRYAQRHELVPDCVVLTPERCDDFHWLPRSCAYRRVHEGRDLPAWHHLRCGASSQVHETGQSVKDKVVPVDQVHEDDHEAMIIHWVER